MTDKPALDPLVIDCQSCNDFSNVITEALNTLRYRLTHANMLQDARIAFVAHPEIIKSLTTIADEYQFELCEDEYIEQNAYLLTISIGDKQLILPPSNMGWDEYFFSLSSGDMNKLKSIRVLLPWAHVKFINVGIK